MDAEFLRQLPLGKLLSLLHSQVSMAQSCDCTFPGSLKEREHPNALLLIGDFAIYPRFTKTEPSTVPKGLHFPLTKSLPPPPPKLGPGAGPEEIPGTIVKGKLWLGQPPPEPRS